MRHSGPFELEFIAVQARTREMNGIIAAIQQGDAHYVCYAEGRQAVLSLKEIDWLKEE